MSISKYDTFISETIIIRLYMYGEVFSGRLGSICLPFFSRLIAQDLVKCSTRGGKKNTEMEINLEMLVTTYRIS
jgi:hypothetical protein